MTTASDLPPPPPPPKPPECRVIYHSVAGPIHFNTKTEFETWKALHWWKRILKSLEINYEEW